MWETGKTSQIAAEMRRYNLAILGISETHWTQVGQKRLAMGEMLLYSGHEEENAPHTQGVALMLSKIARNALARKHNISTQAYKQGYMDLTGPHYREPNRSYLHQTAIQRFNTAFLRDTDRLNEFKKALNNRFQALQDLLKEEETTMEGNWKSIKQALTSTCQEVLGLKKHLHEEWISIETLDKIKERKNKKTAINNSLTRAEKVKTQAEYTEANRQVKRSIRADK
ncbi:unnamed protein product [Schistosoma margrebowiei]|uniref:Uncharacterized protein n=1 Tax=Schistosoma margrebowiei TaxID=48269 RepID=A0A183LXC1_9TREM|nr:unnamed protein product [Schistosoma margrebowiei]